MKNYHFNLESEGTDFNQNLVILTADALLEDLHILTTGLLTIRKLKDIIEKKDEVLFDLIQKQIDENLEKIMDKYFDPMNLAKECETMFAQGKEDYGQLFNDVFSKAKIKGLVDVEHELMRFGDKHLCRAARKMSDEYLSVSKAWLETQLERVEGEWNDENFALFKQAIQNDVETTIANVEKTIDEIEKAQQFAKEI